MKFLSAITLSASAILANPTPNDDCEGPECLGRKLGQTKGMLAHKLGTSEEDANRLVRYYGCYCYSLGSKNVGPQNNFNGEPKDELDALCKKLYRSQKCIGIDNEDGLYDQDKTCDLDSAYQWYTDGNGNVVCEDPNAPKKNPNACKINNCNLENDFTDKVVALLNSGSFTRNDDFYKWSESEYDQNCQRIPNQGNGGRDLSCCGNGIDRKSYSVIANQCCNNELVSHGSC